MVLIVGPVDGSDAPPEAAAYDPATNSWRRLPAFPAAAGLASGAGKRTTVKPVGIAAAWTGRDLLAWAIYELSSRSPSGAGSFQLVDRALSWSPGAQAWHSLPGARQGRPLLGALATWTGQEVLFASGTSCPPGLPCPLQLETPVMTYDPSTGAWGSLTGSHVLDGEGPVVWTGQALVAIDGQWSMSVPSKFAVVPGDAAALDLASKSWKGLPKYPFGALDEASAVWTGSALVIWGSDGVGPAHGAALGAPAAG
jgi:hypothetical protein